MVIAKSVTTIIFDLGGVLLNLDYSLTQKAFEELGLHSFEDVYTQHQQSGLFDQFETGVIDGQQFPAALQMLIPDASPVQLQNAWNAMLLDFPEPRMRLLKELAKDYTLVLFSNTNEIHYDAFNSILEDAQLPKLSEVFHHTIFSHKVGLRKPTKAAFHMALQLAGCEPEQCLFIDDSMQHIESAASMGIHTHYFQENEVTKLFPDRVQ